MKEHAKKALKHDFEVAGKTIPTLAVALLFLVGTGSAALLSSFGTVSGEADVEQAVVVGDSSGNNELGFFGASHGDSADVTAGTVTVDTFTVENNMNTSYTPEFASYTGESPDLDNTDPEYESTQFTWNEGINTSFVEYYPQAGADIPTYQAPETSECDVRVGDGNSADNASIYDGVDYAESGETICVEQGTYGGEGKIVLNDKSLVSLEGPSSTIINKTAKGKRGFDLEGNYAKLKGFNIIPPFSGKGAAEVVSSSADEVHVVHNIINDVVAGDGTVPEDEYSIIFTDAGDSSDRSYVRNNIVSDNIYFKGVENLEIRNNIVNDSEYGAIGVQNVLDGATTSDVRVTQNTLKNSFKGMFLATDMSNITVTRNFFENNSAYALQTGAINSLSPSEVDLSRNRFADSNDLDIDNTLDSELDASDNFFAQGVWEEVENGNFEGEVSASYEKVDSIPANSTKTVAAVNQFALMLDGSQDYSLTTTIQ